MIIMSQRELFIIQYRGIYKLYLAKYLSLMDSGTLTPDTSTLVEVASRNLWFTLKMILITKLVSTF